MKESQFILSIEEKINKKAKELFALQALNSEWTNALLADLVKFGNELQYYTCCSHGEANCGEWLYDLSFIKYGQNEQGEINPWNLQELFMVLESEWGNYGAIWDDYTKLVQAKANYKILLFEQHNNKNFKNITKELSEQAKQFPACKNEVYLLSCWLRDQKEFKHKTFTLNRCKDK